MVQNGTGLDKPIYYVNDLNFQDGYYSFERHRTPHAYMELFPWQSLSWQTLYSTVKEGENIIFVQTPTSDEKEKLRILLPLMGNNKVFINQESTIFDWFDWDGETQALYIECLSKCTAFCYHNEQDKELMKAFTSNFVKYPGCVNLFVEHPREEDHGSYVSIAGPFKRYQRGMIVHKLVHDTVPSDVEVRTMRYNRPPEGAGITSLSFPDSYRLGNMKLQDFMRVDQWHNYIFNAKFGVDIQREYSCGNNCIEFASLGVPLIGNIDLDCQRDIFPLTSFEYRDYDGIKKAIKLLLEDKDFYKTVSAQALTNVKNLYNSTLIVENFKQEVNKFL